MGEHDGRMRWRGEGGRDGRMRWRGDGRGGKKDARGGEGG